MVGLIPSQYKIFLLHRSKKADNLPKQPQKQKKDKFGDVGMKVVFIFNCNNIILSTLSLNKLVQNIT